MNLSDTVDSILNRKRKIVRFLKTVFIILTLMLMTIYGGNRRVSSDVILVFPGTEPPIKGDKWVLYFCDEEKIFCGGLADRLKGMVLTNFVSQLSGRKFGIHMTYPPCDYKSFFAMDSFDFDLFKTKSFERHVYVDDVAFYNLTKTINFDSYFKEDVVKIRGNMDYWNNLRVNPLYRDKLNTLYPKFTYDKIFQKMFPKIFSLGSDLNTKFQKVMKIAKPEQFSKLACAHIRMGITESMPNEHVIRATLNDSIKVMDLLQRYKNMSEFKIFVMSDSENVVRMGREEFKDRFIEIEGDVLHFELFEGDQKKICPAFERTILEYHILMQCDVLIISKSGLSRTAAYVRGTEDDLYCLHNNEIKPCIPSQLREVYGIRG